MYAIVPLNIRLACMNIPKTMFLTKDVFLYKNGQEAKKCFMCFKQKKGLNDNLFYYYFQILNFPLYLNASQGRWVNCACYYYKLVKDQRVYWFIQHQRSWDNYTGELEDQQVNPPT